MASAVKGSGGLAIPEARTIIANAHESSVKVRANSPSVARRPFVNTSLIPDRLEPPRKASLGEHQSRDCLYLRRAHFDDLPRPLALI